MLARDGHDQSFYPSTHWIECHKLLRYIHSMPWLSWIDTSYHTLEIHHLAPIRWWDTTVCVRPQNISWGSIETFTPWKYLPTHTPTYFLADITSSDITDWSPCLLPSYSHHDPMAKWRRDFHIQERQERWWHRAWDCLALCPKPQSLEKYVW